MIVLLYSVVPHITNAIQEWVERVALIPVDGDQASPEVCIIEVIIGSKLLVALLPLCQMPGTIAACESNPFLY